MEDTFLRHVAIGLLIIAASMIIGRVLKGLLNLIFSKLFARTATTLDDRILDVIRARITFLTALAGVYFGLLEIRKGIQSTDTTSWELLEYAHVVLFIIAVFVITRLVSRIVKATFEWYMDEISAKTRSDITPTLAPLLSKIVNILLLLIAGMIVLDHFGVNIGSLLVSLGVGSLAIALAAQETVANIIAGVVILVDQPYRIGDRIRLSSGEEGDIYQIGLRSTRILNYDNNIVIVPNSEMVKNRIINFSFPDAAIRVLIEISVAHGTDLSKARSIMTQAAAAHPDVMKQPVPAVYVMEIGQQSIQLRLSARTASFDKKFDIETELRELIYESFRKQSIAVPYPHTVVHMAEEHGSHTS